MKGISHRAPVARLLCPVQDAGDKGAVSVRPRTERGSVRKPRRSENRAAATRVALSKAQGALDDKALWELAIQAREGAIVPMSGFRVGAAATTVSGKVLTGANLEISDRPGLGTCAECNIAFQARGEPLDTIVIVSDAKDPIAPCGNCRQTLAEVAPEARVVMSNGAGEMRIVRAKDLLPEIGEVLRCEAQDAFGTVIEKAKAAAAKSEVAGSKLPAQGAAILTEDGGIHLGATRKGRGTLTRAIQMAVDSRFLATTAAVRAVVLASGEAPLPWPSGRDRQELYNLDPDVTVLLVNTETNAAIKTTPRALLPHAYKR